MKEMDSISFVSLVNNALYNAKKDRRSHPHHKSFIYL